MSASSSSSSSQRRLCIIGAGTAGLCTLRHAIAHNMEVTVYEQSEVIGGTWVYSENLEDGPFDEEVHSSMYDGLRTNLPKEVMGFPDFLYPPDSPDESFIGSKDVLNFLYKYANNFNLRDYIKFSHHVLRVRPRNDKWEVIVVNLKNKRDMIEYFDYIIVCNGHYSSPRYPKLQGLDEYEGRKLHSHYFRKAEHFKDEVVLVIGAGASGVDIALHIHKFAKRVLLSHHMDPEPDTKFMKNVFQKPDVVCFTKNGAIFSDDTSEAFASVIFCTGYNSTFPFLAVDCGIQVDDNYVQPLYKHCININYPTMTIIGLPFLVCPTQLYDLQARFALKYYSKQKELPSREAMLADTEKDMNARWERGLSKRQAHVMGQNQFEHYRDLAETAGIAKIKPVVAEIIKDCNQKYIFELESYRSNRFRVIDDEHFEKYSLKK